MTDIRKEIEAKLVNTNEGYALRFKDVQPLAEEITRLRTVEAELKRLKETEGVEWLSTPTIDRLQDAEERAIKAERERDEWRTTAQKNAREAGRYMGLLDEVLEALVPFVQFNTSEAVLSITVPSSAVTAARAILAKHERK